MRAASLRHEARGHLQDVRVGLAERHDEAVSHPVSLRHQAPLWAQALMRRVLDEHMPGADDAGEAPWLVWKRSKHVLSQGELLVGGGRAPILTVWAGRRKLDQKLVLLHELAHWLRPPDERHSPAFWALAWELYRRHRVPIKYALRSEGAYKQGATRAYLKARMAKRKERAK